MAGKVEAFMLDTNLFNDLADGKMPLSVFAGRPLFATHIQLDELNNIPDAERRGKICASLRMVDPGELVTSGAIWDVSRWDGAQWPEDDLLERMRPLLEELDKKACKKKTAYNQACDLLIAATAVKRGLTLVTNDSRLRTVVQQFGGSAINATDFASGAKNAT